MALKSFAPTIFKNAFWVTQPKLKKLEKLRQLNKQTTDY